MYCRKKVYLVFLVKYMVSILAMQGVSVRFFDVLVLLSLYVVSNAVLMPMSFNSKLETE